MTGKAILIGLVGVLFSGTLWFVLQRPGPAPPQADGPKSATVAKVGESARPKPRRATRYEHPVRHERPAADEPPLEPPVSPLQETTWPAGIAEEVYGSKGLADSLSRAMNDPSSRDVTVNIDCSEFPCLIEYLGEKVVPTDVDRIVQEISDLGDGEEVAMESTRSSTIHKGGSVTHSSFFSFYPKSIQTEELRSKTKKRIRVLKTKFDNELSGKEPEEP